MITTVAWDTHITREVVVNSFIEGGISQITSRRDRVDGKGLRVARAIARLGSDVTISGIVFEDCVSQINASLPDDHIRRDWQLCKGVTPYYEQIVESETSNASSLFDMGSAIAEKELSELTEHLQKLAQESEYMIFCGELPDAISEEVFSNIVQSCTAHCKVLLDTDTSTLLQGITQAPILIKPNRFEMEALVNMPLPTLPFVKDAALSVQTEGVDFVAVSLGYEGALLTDGRKTYYAEALGVFPAEERKGAGDAMLAGFAIALERKLTTEDILRYGIAAAAASLLNKDELLPKLEDFEQGLDMVRIKLL